jgi:hypothetical protein
VETSIRPIYGQGFFDVSSSVIFYTIVFDYYDPSGDYARILRDYRARRDEEAYIRGKMQEFINEERILVNGERVTARVASAKLELRGNPHVHSAVIHVVMEYNTVMGTNVYEDFYEPERAEYDYTVYWQVPPGGVILHVETPGKVYYEDNRRIAVIHVRKGTFLDGYEAVMFRLNNQREQLRG